MTGDGQRAGANEHSNDDATDDDGIGMVRLVDGGPGDPELLTMKAAHLIDETDAVLHDKLPGPGILEMIPVKKCEDVDKCAGGEWAPREYTNTRLVGLAREGKDVVHLEGGDPFVFGRGGEEMEHLTGNGIPFGVVPGITSAVAGADAAGIPVTHRDRVSSASFVTGHGNPTKNKSAIDWGALAATGGTLVVLMGVGKLPLYTTKLREAGLAGDTPVALAEQTTWPDMRVTTGALDTIVDMCDETDTEPPVITVIGEVAAIHDHVKEFPQDDGADAIEMGAGASPTSGDAGGNE